MRQSETLPDGTESVCFVCRCESLEAELAVLEGGQQEIKGLKKEEEELTARLLALRQLNLATGTACLTYKGRHGTVRYR